MRTLTSVELERMQDAQEAAMMDRCDILRLAEGGTDAYGKPLRSWVPSSEYVECGFGYPRPREGLGLAQVAELDAVLRLPLWVDVTNLDRVRVTHRFGVKLATAATYEATGPIKRGPSGVVLGLKLATV